ncbi:hypothetical protein [Nonomuraea sp. NPDC049709]|uniref:hypothetical protein n=1 Tax=Nonomuraea sp. NPDC049709 TaxID=3154736 RepID=UPI003442B919
MTLAKYELIDAEKAYHPIARMFAWLGVSRSDWQLRALLGRSGPCLMRGQGSTPAQVRPFRPTTAIPLSRRPQAE